MRFNTCDGLHIEIIADCGVSSEQFFNALKNNYDDDETDTAFYVEMLLAVTDYSNFVDMIKHYKRDQKKQ